MWMAEVIGFWKYGINALVSVHTDAQPIAEKYRCQQKQEPPKPEEKASKKIKATATRPPLG